jgi:hypothetical protein
VKPEEEEELKRLQLDDLRTKKNRRDVAAGCGGFLVAAVLAGCVLWLAATYIGVK